MGVCVGWGVGYCVGQVGGVDCHVAVFCRDVVEVCVGFGGCGWV